MRSYIKNFTTQLREAMAIGEKAKLSAYSNSIQNVVIIGLGGSGIGGTIVSEIVAPFATAPIAVNKDYFLPAYVNENTLVIVSSYSGNTEETVQALQIALDKKAKIVCVTSGGKVLEVAKEKGLDFILIPGGMPPRACLGYSLTQLFYILNFYNIISDSFKKDLVNSIKLLDLENESIQNEAENIAKKLLNKIPVVYASAGSEGISVRFRQQLNENAKVLAWHNVIPEMNHNELVGWTKPEEGLAVVIFRSGEDYDRIRKRIEINKKVIEQYAPEIIEIYAKGGSSIERMFYYIHIGDWISVFLADLKGIDAMEVKVIEHLKSSLQSF